MMTTEPIVLERMLNASPARIWKALTDKNEMKNWYFDLKEFKPEVGFGFQFTGGKPDGIEYVHLCEITIVIPEKKLTYSWRYEGYPGISFVSFELFEAGDQTLLRLTHEGLDTFPGENMDFARENFNEGWNFILNQSLKEHIEKAEN